MDALDIQSSISELNTAQREAVTAPPGHLFVLAGAGSGKTRVLVQRIAWLVHQEAISPHSILAVTFTNKAANEMRQRLESLLQIPTQPLWIGTFHGLAHRMLRIHWENAVLPENFQILDADDQTRLIKRVITAMGLDEKRWPAKQLQGFINGRKDEGQRPGDLGHYQDPYRQTQVRIYAAYETLCQQNGVLDFAELLLRSYELLLKNADILAHYRRRFQHILVDEFQDTNAIQYAWLKLLSEESFVTIVGDDDQSIYGWRGAQPKNIQYFTEDFKNARVIRLEQNYRSTDVILKASNALIANNAERLGKNLWTQGESGELITLYAAFNDLDEARFIADKIQYWLKRGIRHSQIALLYRANALSRVLEETLIQVGIPYRIYGGLRFFERAEIKDALAYLRLLANRHDDAAFERAIQTPTRGVGEQTLEGLRETARLRKNSLWQAAVDGLQGDQLPPRARQAVGGFLHLIDQMDKDTAEKALPDLTQIVIQQSGLFAHFEKEKGEKAQARLENLDELVHATKQFREAPSPLVGEPPYSPSPLAGEGWGGGEQKPLQAFLAHIALEAGEYQDNNTQDQIQLMTLHSAKGLEFPIVFLCGLEEDLFPHHLSINEPGKLEEERRLCYVGMTRAMQKLYISYAEIRRTHGSERYNRASRFIGEIPEDWIESVRAKTNLPPSLTLPRKGGGENRIPSPLAGEGARRAGEGAQWYPGQKVRHPTFGTGVVLNVEGQDERLRLNVKFPTHGSKWLVAQYARLEVLA